MHNLADKPMVVKECMIYSRLFIRSIHAVIHMLTHFAVPIFKLFSMDFISLELCTPYHENRKNII